MALRCICSENRCLAKSHQNKPKEVEVSNPACVNTSDQGKFVGFLCMPCWNEADRIKILARRK